MQLLSQGKTGKYLKYAMGEIVLVVIGILIALQINNWNEAQKAREKETSVLKSLVNSIDNDIWEYDTYVSQNLTTKKRGIDSLQDYASANKTITEPLFIEFYKMAKQDVHFRFGNGPFEALKSSGLELIRNDSLRTHINNTYTSDVPIAVLLGNDFYYENKLKVDELYYKLIAIKREMHPDGTSQLVERLKTDDVLHNDDFLWALQLEMNKYDEDTLRIRQIRTSLLDLKSAIERELQR
ncbi:DUF6090 family protein [Psychroserpens sp. BH13MA-6]